MTLRRAVPRLLAPALAGLLLAGCRNPFNPNAIVTLERFVVNGIFGQQYYLTVTYADANTDILNGTHHADVVLRNYSSVAVEFSSYSLVYRDLSLGSSPISLGGAAGVRFPITADIQGLNNNSSRYQTGAMTIVPFTTPFYQYINLNGPNMAAGGGMDIDVTLFGQDANGYDVRVEGTLHVEIQ